MSHDLNSVLLEGDVVTPPTNDEKAVYFTIGSNRMVKEDEAYLKMTTEFNIVVTQQVLADQCEAELEVGRRIRVVGRLGKVNGLVVIITEHVEFKPKKVAEVDE